MLEDTSQAPRRAWRSTADSLVGGVAAGLAQHLHLKVNTIRLFFVVATLCGGLGVGLYAGLWLFLPPDSRFHEVAPGVAAADRNSRRLDPTRTVTSAGPWFALAVLGAGAVLVVQLVAGPTVFLWPTALAIGGLALIWRQADEAQRARWRDTSARFSPTRAVLGSGGWAAVARLASGLALLALALFIFALRSGPLDVAVNVFLAGVLGLVGLVVMGIPWVVRIVNDLAQERAERVRGEERADVAAHLHDSVLQTLALIQQNSADAAKVATLARIQERDLRRWLFAPPATQSLLSGAIAALVADLESAYPVVVEVVSVGDCPNSEPVDALVQAAREAMVNAAKHAGVDQVDAYFEVQESSLEAYVRDRGTGFDPEAVAPDRQGIRLSMIDRLHRHGGSAHVRSEVGTGTEVTLRVPLSSTKETT